MISWIKNKMWVRKYNSPEETLKREFEDVKAKVEALEILLNLNGAAESAPDNLFGYFRVRLGPPRHSITFLGTKIEAIKDGSWKVRKAKKESKKKK